MTLVVIIFAVYFWYHAITKITIASDIPGITAALSNQKYFEQKLDEVGFWKPGNITVYSLMGTGPVTAKKIKIVLTDAPQLYGRLVEDPASNKSKIFRSYGQFYDGRNGYLTVYLHVDRTGLNDDEINRKYSAELLTAIFDMTNQNVPEMMDSAVRYEKQKQFLNAYFQSEIAKSYLVVSYKK